ncbi:MAG: hypothetical protein JO307_19530 [Bryobacterales bacterium]|nr:hypothetical protein [Bryobacterales bacterium]MBV9400293.1 hypothetical protein [Bryobacterales bacterium]
MSDVTLHIPDDLAERLSGHEHQLREILESGLRELSADVGFPGAANVLELLATLPSPQEILHLRPSEDLQKRIDELLEKSRAGPLTPAEETEWDRYEYLEHLVRLAKASAKSKLRTSSGNA